jgi:hypothetical protein
MSHKAILKLFVAIVIGSIKVTAAPAHGGGAGDYPLHRVFLRVQLQF